MNTTVSRRTVVGGMAGAAALTTLPRHPADATTVLSESSASERGARSVSPLRPIRSTTEHLTDPLGIDTTRPRFGWQLEAAADTDRSGENRSQTAYRILVATSKERVLAGDPDAWDSGRVKSGEQTARLYDGEPLRSRTRYYWAVQVWDEHGRPGPLSPIGWFETAMLDPQKEWTAAWIGSGIEVPRSVQTLSPADRGEKTLEPGHTLGQTITSPGPMVAVGILLGGSGAAVMTLRRGGPDGAVLGRKPIESIEGETLGRVDLEETAPAGTYYVELAEPRGEVLWTSVEADVYPGGTAFEDGDPVEGHDRWVCTIPTDPPANPLLRKEFDVADEIASARLYVVGLGLGIPWINGHRVGDAVLSPSVTDYDQRILYSTYDVTRLLRRGRNAIGIALGRGFYSTRAPESDGSHLKPWVAEPRARAQLEIRLRGGRTIVVGTGPDWQVTEGPTTYEAILTGESYDARRAVELDGWTRPGFDADGWRHAEVVADPGGRMQAFATEPMRTAEPIRPVRVTTPAAGVRLYDFGVVLAGWCRLRGRFPKGTTIRLLHHEKLGPSGRIEVGAPGGVHNPSIVGRLQLDEFTASGQGEETWESSFNYKGFQYVEVTGTSAPLELVAVPVLSDLADTMDLELGHPVLQWIADAFRQTLRNGLHGYPDVAPFSKLGWVGQTYLAGKPMLYQFGMAGLLEKWLDDLRLNQTPEGELPITAPMGEPSGWPGPSITIAYPYLVHQYWLMYGDRTIPERHYDAVRKHIAWLLGKLENGISTDIFADWYPPHLTTPVPAGPGRSAPRRHRLRDPDPAGGRGSRRSPREADRCPSVAGAGR
ncbi:MAG TPA: family 78 glycoside hydrolase catalytic domain, partial [Actinopolymorphaceae bacterium]